MATEWIAATTDATTSSQVDMAGPFIVYGVNFGKGESAVLQQLIDGTWRDVTDERGSVGVSNTPNTMYWDGSGSFRIRKNPTQLAASVSYEVQ